MNGNSPSAAGPPHATPQATPQVGELSLQAGYLMIVCVTIFWATGLVILRGYHETVPPIGISFWRWLFAAGCLVPIILPRLRRELPLVLGHWRYFAVMAFFMIGGSALSAVALNFTTAVNGTIVTTTQPAMTAVIAWLLIGDRLSPVQMLGFIAAALGITIIVTRADIGVLLALNFNLGDFLMLGAVVGYSLYAVRLPRMPRGISLSVAVLAVFVIGFLQLLPLYVAESFIYMPVPMDLKTGVMLFLLGLVTSTIPVFMWSRAVPVVGVSRSAIFINLVPVFGAILAVGFLGERLALFHFLGAVLIFAGIVLVVRRPQATS